MVKTQNIIHLYNEWLMSEKRIFPMTKWIDNTCARKFKYQWMINETKFSIYILEELLINELAVDMFKLKSANMHDNNYIHLLYE